MACTTHRFCTCDIYCTCYNVHQGGSSPGRNCSDYIKNKTTYDTSKGNNPDNVICYTYETTHGECIANELGNKSCYPHAGRYSYDCPGHRDYKGNEDIIYQIYQDGSIIEHEQINVIQEYIRKEIEQRKRHAMYKKSNISYDQNDVKVGELVLARQPNLINEALDKLRIFVKNYVDYKDAPTTNYSKIKNNVQIGKIAYASQMKQLEKDLNDMYIDCICYSDCTTYGLWYYNKCSCNMNCGCNYSDERLKYDIIYIKSIAQNI